MRANLASLGVRTLRLGLDRARAKDFQWLFTNRRIAPRQRRHVMMCGSVREPRAYTSACCADIPLSLADVGHAAG
jgi:hypothetical protein